MKTFKTTLLTIAVLLCSISASAHDFEVDGIYYNITSSIDLTVEVTCRGSGPGEYSNEYTGEITIPENVVYNGSTYSVTSIGDDAFYKCSGLTSITIPESVTSIGDDAFSGCSGLTSITIPESVTSIGDDAFSGCSGLTSITIPESVTSIGDEAFYRTPWYEQQPDGIIYVNDVLYQYKGEMPANTSIEIKESTISISDYAFYDCTGLTSITIPNSVTSIGDHAFYACSGLTSITIPESVTSIGGSAFSECTGLTSITIPNSVGSIGGGAFYGCSDLTSATIGNSVTSIEWGTFYCCSSLTSITIPESVTSIESEAFIGCKNITDIIIPNSVTSIGEQAFIDCKNLKIVINFSKLTIEKGSSSNGYVGCYADRVINYTDLEYEQFGDFIFRNEENYKFYLSAYTGSDNSPSLPENFYGKAYEIDDYAFFGNRDITDITIPDFVTSIGAYAFDKCENLKTITMTTATPPKVGKRNFSTMAFRTVVVRVPRGSLAAYQTADFWRSFWNIEEFDVNSIEGFEMDVNNAITPIYNLQGIEMKEKENLPAGIYIQGGKKIVIK